MTDSEVRGVVPLVSPESRKFIIKGWVCSHLGFHMKLSDCWKCGLAAVSFTPDQSSKEKT